MRELKLWLHTTSQGISRPIPAEVILERCGEPQRVPLGAGCDQVILPHDGASCTITILIQGSARAESGA